MKKLADTFAAGDKELAGTSTRLLYDQAVRLSGRAIEDPTNGGEDVTKLILTYTRFDNIRSIRTFSFTG